MLLEQIETDEFMIKVVTTLYNLYRMKDKKYSAIEERVKKSIKLDIFYVLKYTTTYILIF